jgi:broad specificity phosphatase PhoE
MAGRNIASLIPLKNMPRRIHAFEDLREQDYGDWEGLTVQEIENRWPGSFADREVQGPTYRPPNGESYSDLVARITPFCADLKPELNYLIVTHKRTSQAIREVLFPGVPTTEHTQDSYFVLDLIGHIVTKHTVGV